MSEIKPILDASNYQDCESYIGETVYIVGKVSEVLDIEKKYKNPNSDYIRYLNFGDFNVPIVKVQVIRKDDNAEWNRWAVEELNGLNGQFISVQGRLRRVKSDHNHLGIWLNDKSKLDKITEEKAYEMLADYRTYLLHHSRPESHHCVEIGDTVTYIDVFKPEEKKTVNISLLNVRNYYEGITNQYSPLGKALLGRKKGDVFTVNLPNMRKFQILEIIHPIDEAVAQS